MFYVYVLKSIHHEFKYIGSTNDLERRINEHNSGESQSTKHYRPFRLALYVALPTERQARELEKYFKTGSGLAVLNKRFLNENL